MTKYTCIKPVGINGTIGYLPGDIVEIKKMKHPIILKKGEKCSYKEVKSGELMSKKYIKENFKQGDYQNEMIKHISKLIFTLAMYELGKYVTEQLIIWWQSDDDLDAPLDFTDADHAHINRLMREVSE